MHYIRLLVAMAGVAAAVAAQPSGTSVLAGKVVQRGNREPVRKAAVSLIWHGTPQSVALARTDSGSVTSQPTALCAGPSAFAVAAAFSA